ncbi:hypothetical protein AVEN_136971-1 [Araneus ventricosus]|uniref:Uncharacterized protein n=1 Tax=Araneus ventricosus TaxID=182803 RepID=A0A4Y2BJH3_ARAVE|nr:hypothetical protein AVEN_136971-1 [Araneus ventricosus]
MGYLGVGVSSPKSGVPCWKCYGKLYGRLLAGCTHGGNTGLFVCFFSVTAVLNAGFTAASKALKLGDGRNLMWKVWESVKHLRITIICYQDCLIHWVVAQGSH